MRELPILDARRCTACGECVVICPTECLEMRGKCPWMPRPLDCISCAACVQLCPVDALEMKLLERA